ncbi:hypothetical protein D187_002699 [Cystobacter fuscus DSM 2262]|uniref:Type IV fimbrial biogenesis protein PilY1 n=1 Tax=Cystobacter fuscus (strain ATCC 25194 / DSM 2262 / NBRC 100088 / M29) TaxID=1242864 RepID=S9P650_CYSF2|nr:hypothetical protein D187_002699 [Cystobacter fuscus DSM 2262]
MLGGMMGAVGLLPLASQAQSPANVIFLLDNSESMQDFPTWLPEAFTPGYSPTSGLKKGDLGFNDPDYGHFINTGCSDPALVAAMSWFDKNSPDPAKNGSVVYDSDPDLNDPYFDPAEYYHSRGRRIAWQAEEFPYSMGMQFRSMNSTADASTVCRQVWNFDSKYPNSPVFNECLSCLGIKGWWRGPLVPATINDKSGHMGPPRAKDEPLLPQEAKRKWVVSGRVLNLRPPKFVVARKALKDVLQTASHVRMGVATFGGDRGWFDPTWVLADVSPSCSASAPFDETRLDRSQLARAVNDTLFRNNERSTGEALFGLGGYFSSQGVDGRWNSWFAQPIGNTNWGWPGQPSGGTYDNPYGGNQVGAGYGKSTDEWLKYPYVDPATGLVLPGQRWESGGDHRSICFAEQSSAVIVVTGGEPRYDNSVPITKMMSLLLAEGARHPSGELLTFDPVDPEHNPNSGGVNYCHLFGATKADCDYTDYNWPTGLAAGNKNFMDDVAFFLSHADLRGDLPGTQNVRTYVIGYGSAHPMLQSIALAGQGRFFQVNEGAALREALQSAIGEASAATP